MSVKCSQCGEELEDEYGNVTCHTVLGDLAIFCSEECGREWFRDVENAKRYIVEKDQEIINRVESVGHYSMPPNDLWPRCPDCGHELSMAMPWPGCHWSCGVCRNGDKGTHREQEVKEE